MSTLFRRTATAIRGSSADAPTVYLVDDHQAFRQSIVTILETAGFLVLNFQDDDSFLTHLSGCAVLPTRAFAVSDARQPKRRGLELLEKMKHRECAIPVIFVVGYADVPLAVQAMRRGAVDVIQEPFSGEALLEAIHLAASASCGASATQHAYSARSSDTKLETLTRRELQVAELIVAGKLNKTIANVLGISCKTVELHRANLMGKLGVRTVPDLVKTYFGISPISKSLSTGSLSLGASDQAAGPLCAEREGHRGVK